MNTIEVTSKNLEISDYVWKNLIIEKSFSLNWLDKLLRGSLFKDFWTLFSSPVD